MSIETEFCTVSIERLKKSLLRIETCVALLSQEQIWARGGENENSVGNLLLHLRGNIRQWILTGVAGQPDHRDRDAEFTARDGASAAELIEGLKATVAEASAVIASLPPARLLEQIQPQGYKVTVLAAVYHVVEHFTGHAFQIIFMTKRFTGRDLGFYAQLSGRAHGRLPEPSGSV